MKLRRSPRAHQVSSRRCHPGASGAQRAESGHSWRLRLSEELQRGYNLEEYPTCCPASTDLKKQQLNELEDLVKILPATLQQRLRGTSLLSELEEVVLDLGRIPLARVSNRDIELSHEPVTLADLDNAVSRIGKFGTDNRAGISSTLHRISCLRNRVGDIIGLTCRVGRAAVGCAAMITDVVATGASVLLLGNPGVGKTTAIRDVSRLLADHVGKRVVICDTSNEIGGDGDVPHRGIGRARRLQVAVHALQHEVMIEAVENHMPQVVVIDEIGTVQETQAARTISQRGVQLIATAHGSRLESLVKNPSLVDLVGGIGTVTLGDDEARRRSAQKSVLERMGPPTFDVCVEMHSRSKWVVWQDVGAAVDCILQGQTPVRQIRMSLNDGSVWVSAEAPPNSAPTEEPIVGQRGTMDGLWKQQGSTGRKRAAVNDLVAAASMAKSVDEAPRASPPQAGRHVPMETMDQRDQRAAIRVWLSGLGSEKVFEAAAAVDPLRTVVQVSEATEADYLLCASTATKCATHLPGGVPVLRVSGRTTMDELKTLWSNLFHAHDVYLNLQQR